MLVKAKEKFQELGIENNYQGLNTEDYFALRRGEIVELKEIPKHLLEGDYIEKIKKEKQ